MYAVVYLGDGHWIWSLGVKCGVGDEVVVLTTTAGTFTDCR